MEGRGTRDAPTMKGETGGFPTPGQVNPEAVIMENATRLKLKF
jgi:hypothetical protein